MILGLFLKSLIIKFLCELIKYRSSMLQFAVAACSSQTASFWLGDTTILQTPFAGCQSACIYRTVCTGGVLRVMIGKVVCCSSQSATLTNKHTNESHQRCGGGGREREREEWINETGGERMWLDQFKFMHSVCVVVVVLIRIHFVRWSTH